MRNYLLFCLVTLISVFRVFAEDENAFLVIDLSSGEHGMEYPFIYLDKPPENSWSDDYKNDRLVLRKVSAGTFEMGRSKMPARGHVPSDLRHPVTLSSDFYIGVFEITQRQWELVMGDRPSYFTDPVCYAGRPVDSVSYSDIRGSFSGRRWPADSSVDDGSFVGKLRLKTGLELLDLPTEAQWEYACRAGTTGDFNDNSKMPDVPLNAVKSYMNENLNDLARYEFNDNAMLLEKAGIGSAAATVGSYAPNKWGLFDMHGNVAEWCLDDVGKYDLDVEIDPRGNCFTGFQVRRVYRGGAWDSKASQCFSSYRNSAEAEIRDWAVGFRLAMHIKPYSEVKVKQFKDVDTGIPEKKRNQLHEEVESLIASGNSIEIDESDKEGFMVVDLSSGTGGSSFSISYISSVPENGWPEKFKTDKLVLRKVPAGKFIMGAPLDEPGRIENDEMPRHPVSLTKPYYIGVFEITQRQWELVMGSRPSYFRNESCYITRPVERVTYNMIRGDTYKYTWPKTRDVKPTSFIGILRAKTEFVNFDLPTEAQWECACRAGSLTGLNNDKELSSICGLCSNLVAVARYSGNNGKGYDPDYDTDSGTAEVGSYQPNGWGIYDMHGNVCEWCLDMLGDYPFEAVVDPKGSEINNCPVTRGGAWTSAPWSCRSAGRSQAAGMHVHATYGFRVAFICQ